MSRLYVAMIILGLGVMVGALGFSSADRQQDVVAVQAQGQDLATNTERCITSSASTSSDACQAAAQKAAEVKQAPTTVTVTVPRRTDAEVRDLIADTIRRNPDLVPRGPAGETPVVDYDRIIAAVQGRIVVPAPIPGKDGETPVVDYDKIVSTVLAQIPVPKDGKPGVDGADSTVPGPAGAPGQPPAGWRWVEHDVLGDVEHFCGRDPGSPDSAPTYTCS